MHQKKELHFFAENSLPEGIGIFGGSFMPTHMGHFDIVTQILQFRNIKRIIIVPTFQNPLKRELQLIDLAIRHEMLVKTFQAFKDVEISQFEINQHKVTYSYDTLLHFREIYPGLPLYFILGEDAFSQFEHWYRPAEILELASLLVFYRPALRTCEPVQLPYAKNPGVLWLDLAIRDISATEIRESDPHTIKSSHWLHPGIMDIWQNI